MWNKGGEHMKKEHRFKESKKSKFKKNFKIFLIFYSFTAVIPFMSLTLAKYVGVINIEDTVKVAQPILNISPLTNLDKISPTNNIDLLFNIYNFDNDDTTKINGVKLKYKIIISFYEEPEVNVPLNISLYDITDADNPVIIDLTNNESSFFTMVASTKVIKNYKIHLSWDEQDKSYTYQNLMKKLNVKVDVEQAPI